jgi:hypothetical protein
MNSLETSSSHAQRANVLLQDCQESVILPLGTLTHHLQHCRPYCNPCYRENVVTRRPPTRHQRTNAPHCRHAPRTIRPNIIMRWFNGSVYYARNPSASSVSRMICRDCSLRSVDELIDMKEKKTNFELKKGLQCDGQRWTKCDRCKTALGTGPRWWVCSIQGCGKECRSVVHKGWGRKEKDNGSCVGEEAV